MAQTYDARLLLTQGGNSTSEVFDTEFLLWTGLAFTQEGLENELENLCDIFRPLFRPDIILKGITLSKAVPKGTKKGKTREILTFDYGKKGSRALQAGYIPTELALGLMFKKASETPGNPGHNLLRGTLLQNELKIGEDGFYVLADNFDYTAVHAFEQAITYEPGATFRIVLPAKGTDNYVNGTRNIRKWTCVGLGRKDLRNNRKTHKQKQDSAAKDEITPIFKEIADAIKDGISPADIVTGIKVSAELAGVILKWGAPIVSRIGYKILGPGSYAAARAALPELLAIAAIA